jgi:hypothetical protein
MSGIGEVVPGPKRVRPILAEAGDGTPHEPRVFLGRLAVAEPALFEVAGPAVVDDNIGPITELPEDLDATGVTSVQSYRPLAGTESGSDPEHGRIGTRRVYPAHLSTLLGKEPCAIGRRRESTKVEHPDAGQWTSSPGQRPAPDVIKSTI